LMMYLVLQSVWYSNDILIYDQSIVNQLMLLRKYHVHHRTDNLDYFAYIHWITLLASTLSGLTARDLQQFLRNAALPQLVVFELQIFYQGRRIVGRARHRHHSGALLTS